MLLDLCMHCSGTSNCKWSLCSITSHETSYQNNIFDLQQVPGVPIMPSGHTGSADLWAKRPSARLYQLKSGPMSGSSSCLLCNSTGKKDRPPPFLSVCFNAPPLGFLRSPLAIISYLLCDWVLYPWVWVFASWGSVPFDSS